MTTRCRVVAALALIGVVSWLATTGTSRAAEVKLESPAPELSGGPWINSDALSLDRLRGRVTLIEFWTYG